MASGVSPYLSVIVVVAVIYVYLIASNWPGVGLLIYSLLFGFLPPGSRPEGDFTLETTLPDCSGVSSNWHYFATASEELEELFVSCVTTGGNFVVKRVDVTDFSVTEVVLSSGVPTSSTIFAYLQTAACPTDAGYIVANIIPRADMGSTPFFAIILDSSGAVRGTVTTTLPGARPDRQAFFCRSAGGLAQFVYHGAGEVIGETDTFSILVSDAAIMSAPLGGDEVVTRRITEARETDLADAVPNRIIDPATGATIKVVYDGLQPVSEIDLDLDGDGSESEVRYGGIVVPIMFDTLETGDFRNWGTVVAN